MINYPKSFEIKDKENPFPKKLPFKFGVDELHLMVKVCRKRFRDKTIIVLMDVDMGFKGKERVIDCSDPANVKELEGLNFEDYVFVYGCQFDDCGYPFAKIIFANNACIMPVKNATPSWFIHVDSDVYAAFYDEFQYQLDNEFSKFMTPDFQNLCQAMSMTKGLEGGAYIEIGTFRGSSGCALLSYLSKAGYEVDCYFLDYFEGFTYEEAKKASDNFWYNTHGTEGPAVVGARFKRFESDKLKITVQKSNIITDELPSEIKQIRVANIDVDLYEATRAAFDKVAPLMMVGGVMICEDVGHTPRLIGARVAIWEWQQESELAKDFTVIQMESGQAFCIRIR